MYRVLSVLSVAAALAACSTAGRNFDTSSLYLVTPGQTTLQQASALMHADPVDVYRQSDGSVIARWAYKSTLATDAVYFNRELWLSFGPDGRYERVVNAINIPRMNQYGYDGDHAAPVRSF
ncbi:hypothetical protein [Parapusillimonas granuli]|uniref:Outer membrane protein assembly factor BamE n=1 Tax=Parapusillimonas granuli TaxID=380911 RepID=A0A853G1A1_9BURK|nr:hypothetical protein [Parapusillimonas granuli]MBB5213387.1 hypothetical protein [Parapusillimonas granuli]MEB2398487.1 hypothetical protein [Alcaligenaceae bacterium]NYT48226.1 hypothetical protein [Parapusillimonas granuli]